MARCIERARLALEVQGASAALTRMLQLEVEVVMSGDQQRLDALELITAECTTHYRAAAAAYFEHITAHGCGKEQSLSD